jgi:ribonucleoside-diphosphate reductase alpha chain
VWSNCYVKDIQKIKTTIKNPFLTKLLEGKGKNNDEVWHDIRNHDGSVQHINWLSEEEKEVFKTYPEIDQMSIIYQASARQEHIDQGQSLNLLIHPDTPVKTINEFYIEAWKMGIKTLYYQHSMNAAQQLNLKKVCKACEG